MSHVANIAVSRDDQPDAAGATNEVEERVQMIEADWRRVLRELGIPTAELLREAEGDTRHRVYRSDGRIYKIYNSLGPGRVGRHSGYVEREFRLVQKCAGIEQVPGAIRYFRDGALEVAAYEAVDASPLRTGDLRTLEAIGVWWRVCRALERLSWRGIVHNDLGSSNILRASDGRCFIIDFDCGEVTTRMRAAYRNFFREPQGGCEGGCGSMWDFTWDLVCRRLGLAYVRYPDCVSAGFAAADGGEVGMAGRYAARVVLMRPWRMAGWGLLFQAATLALTRLVRRQRNA